MKRKKNTCTVISPEIEGWRCGGKSGGGASEFGHLCGEGEYNPAALEIGTAGGSKRWERGRGGTPLDLRGEVAGVGVEEGDDGPLRPTAYGAADVEVGGGEGAPCAAGAEGTWPGGR